MASHVLLAGLNLKPGANPHQACGLAPQPRPMKRCTRAGKQRCTQPLHGARRGLSCPASSDSAGGRLSYHGMLLLAMGRFPAA